MFSKSSSITDILVLLCEVRRKEQDRQLQETHSALIIYNYE